MNLSIILGDPVQPGHEKAALTHLLGLSEIDRIIELKRYMETPTGDIVTAIALTKRAKLSPISLKNLLKYGLLRSDAYGAILWLRTVKDSMSRQQLLDTVAELKDVDPARHELAAKGLASI